MPWPRIRFLDGTETPEHHLAPEVMNHMELPLPAPFLRETRIWF